MCKSVRFVPLFVLFCLCLSVRVRETSDLVITQPHRQLSPLAFSLCRQSHSHRNGSDGIQLRRACHKKEPMSTYASLCAHECFYNTEYIREQAHLATFLLNGGRSCFSCKRNDKCGDQQFQLLVPGKHPDNICLSTPPFHWLRTHSNMFSLSN